MMNFGEFIGNEKIIERLRKSVAAERLSHASLFYGKEGIGKKSLAMTIAGVLNCRSETDGPCGECGSCRKIGKQIHPDVTVFEPEGTSIKIDQVRELTANLEYKPFEGKKRVLIIDNAETMTRESANSLLKSLEEPPEHAAMFLITSNLNMILPTIKSRCRIFRFMGIPAETIRRYLAEKAGYSEDEAHRAATLADGSLGRALEMEIGEFTKKRDSLLRTILKLIVPNGGSEFIECAEELSSGRDDMKREMEIIQGLFRDVTLITADSDPALVINKDVQGKLLELSRCFDARSSREITELISRYSEKLDRNVNPRLLAENLFLEIKNKKTLNRSVDDIE